MMAVDKTGQLSSMILNSIVKMVRGLIGLDNLSGPITIAKVAGQSAEMGWQTFISFMALDERKFRNFKFLAYSNA